MTVKPGNNFRDNVPGILRGRESLLSPSSSVSLKVKCSEQLSKVASIYDGKRPWDYNFPSISRTWGQDYFGGQRVTTYKECVLTPIACHCPLREVYFSGGPISNASHRNETKIYSFQPFDISSQPISRTLSKKTLGIPKDVKIIL